MPRTDRSITILTGTIIAGLYVILLVSFSQESYMRQDAMRQDAASRLDRASHWPVIHDVSKRVCRTGAPLCAALFPDAAERQSCLTSIDAVRRYLSSEPLVPLTLEGVRRAMNDEP